MRHSWHFKMMLDIFTVEVGLMVLIGLLLSALAGLLLMQRQ